MKNIFSCLLFFTSFLQAQKIQILTQGNKTSLRGLSVVDKNIIWASGSNGTVARSTNGGNSWKWFTVKGFEQSDFRDIEAFDSSTAIIMAIAEPAYILKTTDGGENWNIVFENKTTGMFLDAMDFKNDKDGIVIGDPVNGKFFIAKTFDGGNTWKEDTNTALADSGKACFASSGTNIQLLSPKDYCFVSGGLRSGFFIKNKSFDIAILQGKQSTGANSIAVKNKRHFIIVGGDFTLPSSTEKNCIITFNKAKTWQQPDSPPNGYRSCVTFINKKNWITCGLNGVDYSDDNGKRWRGITTESFHVCKKAKHGNEVFLAGANGKIARLTNNFLIAGKMICVILQQ